MKKFQEFLVLREIGESPGGQPPMSGGLGGPPIGGGLGGPPMSGGLGGPPMGGGLGGPPMGGGSQGIAQVDKIQSSDVWSVLERILEGKPAEKPRQKNQNQVSSTQPDQLATPSPTGNPLDFSPPPNGMAGNVPQQPQHLQGAPNF